MSTSDDLLAALRRSDDPADRRLADLLGGLSPGSGSQASGPRANDELASFLVGTDPVAARLTDQPVTGHVDDLVVVLGRPTPRRPRMRPSTLVSLRQVLATSLIAKTALGLTIALTGAGAVAASGAMSGPEKDVVVVAADDGASGTVDAADASVAVLHDFDGLAHADAVEEPEGPEEADDSEDAPVQPAPGAGPVTAQDPPARDNEPDDDDSADDDSADDDVSADEDSADDVSATADTAAADDTAADVEDADTAADEDADDDDSADED